MYTIIPSMLRLTGVTGLRYKVRHRKSSKAWLADSGEMLSFCSDKHVGTKTWQQTQPSFRKLLHFFASFRIPAEKLSAMAVAQKVGGAAEAKGLYDQRSVRAISLVEMIKQTRQSRISLDVLDVWHHYSPSNIVKSERKNVGLHFGTKY